MNTRQLLKLNADLKKFNKFNSILERRGFEIILDSRLDNVICFIPGRTNKIIIRQECQHLFLKIKHIILSAAHEVGHFLAATPQRRKRKDFGIPANVNGLHENKKRHNRIYYIEEAKAQFIHQEIMIILGFKNNYRNNRKFAGLYLREENSVKNWWKAEGKQLIHDFMNVK